MWVTCLFVKEKLWGAQICLKISVRHFGSVIILRGYDFFSRSSLKYWYIFLCTQFHWKMTCDTNMRDDNFFATKTLACGTKTWPITISVCTKTFMCGTKTWRQTLAGPWTWPPANRTWPPSNRPRVCLCYWQYSISIMYCLGQSFVLPNRHRVLTASQKAAKGRQRRPFRKFP